MHLGLASQSGKVFTKSMFLPVVDGPKTLSHESGTGVVSFLLVVAETAIIKQKARPHQRRCFPGKMPASTEVFFLGGGSPLSILFGVCT